MHSRAIAQRTAKAVEEIKNLLGEDVSVKKKSYPAKVKQLLELENIAILVKKKLSKKQTNSNEIVFSGEQVKEALEEQKKATVKEIFEKLSDAKGINKPTVKKIAKVLGIHQAE